MNEKVSSTDDAFGIQLPDCSKLVIEKKMTMKSRFADMTSSSNFFDVLFLVSSLVNGPSFHVNIITSSEL